MAGSLFPEEALQDDVPAIMVLFVYFCWYGMGWARPRSVCWMEQMDRREKKVGCACTLQCRATLAGEILYQGQAFAYVSSRPECS